MEKSIQINCDGGARGNPGPAAAAFIVRRGNKILHKHAEFIGKTTNNVAEYRAVIAALNWLMKNQLNIIENDITFFMDSELITKQLLGVYKTKNIDLKKLIETAKFLESKINKKIFYKLIPREKNKDVDFLVNEIF
jgi:ribonuclease HI